MAAGAHSARTSLTAFSEAGMASVPGVPMEVARSPTPPANIQMYSDVVMEVGKSYFEKLIDEMKEEKGISLDTELDADDLKKLDKVGINKAVVGTAIYTNKIDLKNVREIFG